jgi:hypothetical protein
MRVYEPDKRELVVKEALKNLYILGQAISHQTGTADSRLKLLNQIRNKLQEVTR